MASNFIVRKNGTPLFNLSEADDIVRRLDILGTGDWEPLTRDILDRLDDELTNAVEVEQRARNKYRCLIGADINADTASEIAESIADAEDDIEELRYLQGQLKVFYWLLADVYDEDEPEKVKTTLEFKLT